MLCSPWHHCHWGRDWGRRQRNQIPPVLDHREPGELAAAAAAKREYRAHLGVAVGLEHVLHRVAGVAGDEAREAAEVGSGPCADLLVGGMLLAVSGLRWLASGAWVKRSITSMWRNPFRTLSALAPRL